MIIFFNPFLMAPIVRCNFITLKLSSTLVDLCFKIQKFFPTIVDVCFNIQKFSPTVVDVCSRIKKFSPTAVDVCSKILKFTPTSGDDYSKHESLCTISTFRNSLNIQRKTGRRHWLPLWRVLQILPRAKNSPHTYVHEDLECLFVFEFIGLQCVQTDLSCLADNNNFLIGFIYPKRNRRL